ncbi:hypothetical protein [Paenibacillus polymyxa]|nr:hypothetical protein [Paenibacillus polymyxa]
MQFFRTPGTKAIERATPVQPLLDKRLWFIPNNQLSENRNNSV